MCVDTTKCVHFLIRKGILDWKHVLERLRSHEHSLEHINATIIFCRRQWRTQKISEGRAKFHHNRVSHNRVTSQINFKGSAEGTTILGGSGDIPLGKFCKIIPKNTHFCAF